MLASPARALLFVGLVAAGPACHRRNANNTIEGAALGESSAPGPRYAVEPGVDAQGTGIVSSRALSRSNAQPAAEVPATAQAVPVTAPVQPEEPPPSGLDAGFGVFSPPPENP